MLKNKSRLKYILPILLSLAVVFASYFFLRGAVPAQVEFTSDTVLDLEGTIAGDLYVAQNSACSSLDISGKNLVVNDIPAGSSFILKTFKHDQALKVSSSMGNIDLDFSSDDLLFGDIASWTINNSGGPAAASIIWGVPAADTWYTVKVNGVIFRSYFSSAASEITFAYDLSSSSIFTLELGGGGSVPLISPAKPDIRNIEIADSEGGLVIKNIPEKIIQVAISSTPDFEKASWEKIAGGNFVTDEYDDASKVYVEFRAANGGVSDVVTYTRNISGIKEGDIVKTKDNFDVYIIKFMSGKRFKRLILSPSVFESYEHLKWENIKVISQAEMDSYTTSSLVKETNDSTIYELFPSGDTGERKIWNLEDYYDADSVYEINRVDRDSYILVK